MMLLDAAVEPQSTFSGLTLLVGVIVIAVAVIAIAVIVQNVKNKKK